MVTDSGAGRIGVGVGCAFLLLFTPGCASSGAGEGGEGAEGAEGAALAQASPAGCYRFEETEGSDALGLPWGVILEEEALGEGWPLMGRFEDVRRARTLASETRTTDHPFGYWRPVPGDSIEIGYPGGGGVTLTVAPTDDGFAGRGRGAGDALRPGEAPGPRPAHPVEGLRVSCPG